MSYFRHLRFSSLITNGWFGIGLIISVWSIVSALELASPYWFAGPIETFQAIYHIFKESSENVFATLILVIVSTLLASCAGILLGMFLGLYNRSYLAFRTTLDFWRSIPPIIVIPIVYRLNPFDDEFFWRVLLVFFGCAPILTALVADAIARCERSNGRASAFLTLNPSKWFLFRYIFGYEVLPTIFTGLRTVSSFALIIIIVSEMVYTPQRGIGMGVIHYQYAFEVNFVYGYAIIAGAIGISLNRFWYIVEGIVVRWSE